MTTINLPAYDGAQRVSQIRVIRSEWTKLRSLPSNPVALDVAADDLIAFLHRNRKKEKQDYWV